MQAFLPQSYLDKLQTFLDVKEQRRKEFETAVQLVQQQRHDMIRDSFRDMCEQMKKWEVESIRRHQDDRALFASRRAHEDELREKHEAWLAQLRSRQRDLLVADTEDGMSSIEANIRRLGLDDSRPQPTTAAQHEAAPAVDPLAENEARVLEIRKRKHIDIRARREKLQRQYVAQQQQLAASQDVLEKQKVDAVVSAALPLIDADRTESIRWRRGEIDREVERQFLSVFLDGEVSRRKQGFVDADAEFAVVAAVERKGANAAFASLRAERQDEEAAARRVKHDGNVEFFSAFALTLVEVAAEVAARNFVTLTDGTVIRRANPPTSAEWRELKEKRLTTKAIMDRITAKKELDARMLAQSAQSPRSKRASSVNLGSLVLTKPFTPPTLTGGSGSLRNSLLGTTSPQGSAHTLLPTIADVDSGDMDTEAADRVLETLNDMDIAKMEKVVAVATASIAEGTALANLQSVEAELEDIVSSGCQAAAQSTSWWKRVVGDIPPAAAFVHGDALSGVQLLGDHRFVAPGSDEAVHLITPHSLKPLIQQLMAQSIEAAASAAAAIAPTNAVAAAASPQKGGAKSAPASKASIRPGSGGTKGTTGITSPAPVVATSTNHIPTLSESPAVYAEALAKTVARHHKRQLEALVRKETAFPPSLLLCNFPCTEGFALEFNRALEREWIEEERTWAPAKILLTLEHNTPRGGQGFGTHRSSINGGTNPNTPHGTSQPASVHVSPAHPAAAAATSIGSDAGVPTASAVGNSKSHAPSPPTFSAAAGKHHTAAINNLALTMFFAPVRVATVFLVVQGMNLVERYRSAMAPVVGGGNDGESQGSAWYHEFWAPPPLASMGGPDRMIDEGNSPGASMICSPTTAAAAGCGSGLSSPTSAYAPPLPTRQETPWHGMNPSKAYDAMEKLVEGNVARQAEWTRAIAAPHRTPVRASTATETAGSPSNASASLFASTFSSSNVAPTLPCAGRLPRVLHFVATVSVDGTPALCDECDSKDVWAQILAVEVRSVTSRVVRDPSHLANGGLPFPLSLSLYSVSDATLDRVIEVAASYRDAQSKWSVKAIAESIQQLAKSGHAFGSLLSRTPDASPNDSGRAPTELRSLLERSTAIPTYHEELSQQLKCSLRGLREIEIESGRCLHHSYLAILQLLECDAFASVHEQFRAAAASDPRANSKHTSRPTNDTAMDRLYWSICDAEVTRVRQKAGEVIGVLSAVLRQLQCVQVKIALDIVKSVVEQVVLATVVSLSTVVRPDDAGDEVDKQDNSKSRKDLSGLDTPVGTETPADQELVAALMQDLSNAFSGVSPPLQLTAEVLDVVHDNGGSVQEALLHIVATFSQSALTAAHGAFETLLHAAGALHKSPHRKQVVTAVVEKLPQIMQQLLLVDTNDGTFGRVLTLLLAPLVEIETFRKQLACGSQRWISFMYQATTRIPRADPAGTASLHRPNNLTDLLSTSDASLTGLLPATSISDVQLDHLTTHVTISVEWERLLSPTPLNDHRVILNSEGFAYALLSAQLCNLHLYVPSSLEDMVNPLLDVSSAASRAATAVDPRYRRSLFLPWWWVSPPSVDEPSASLLAADRCPSAEGHFYTRESCKAIFSNMVASRNAVDSNGEVLDVNIWLSHLVAGLIDPQHLFALDDIRNSTSVSSWFSSHRFMAPNLIQVRNFFLSLDHANATASPDTVTWWPVFGGGGGAESQGGADAAVADPRRQHVLRQLWRVWTCSHTTDRTLKSACGGQLAMESAESKLKLMRRACRWILCATSGSSGPSAVVETAFAIAASLSTKLDVDAQQPQHRYRPQPLSIAHNRAYIPVDLIVSVLRTVFPMVTTAYLHKFVLLTKQHNDDKQHLRGGDGAENEARPTQPSLFAPPIASRLEEITLISLTSSHAGMHLLGDVAIGPRAVSLLPNSDAVI